VKVARSPAKIEGHRLLKTITGSCGERALNNLPAALATSVELLPQLIDLLSMAIEEAAEDIEFPLKTRYAEAMRLMQIPGVGAIPVLSFVLSAGAPERFRDSRDVWAFLGMKPKRKQSGERDP